MAVPIKIFYQLEISCIQCVETQRAWQIQADLYLRFYFKTQANNLALPGGMNSTGQAKAEKISSLDKELEEKDRFFI